MQNNDIDKAARSLLSSPQGIRIIRILDKMNALSSTESGIQLINMLAGSGSDIIKSSAKAAQAATSDRARAFLGSMLGTKEGTALIAKVIEVCGE